MKRQWTWLSAVWMTACVGEAPALPEVTGLGTTGTTPTTSGGMSKPPGTTTDEGDSSTSATPESSTSTSTGPVSECGNGDVERGEECDGIDRQETTCESLGFIGGTLACSTRCMLDTSGCHLCGNGVVDAAEACEQDDVGEQTCEGLGLSGSGLTCVGCQLDASACGPPPGMVEVPGGEFEMGSTQSLDEQPTRMVQVDRFWMDQTEVTVADYADCVNDGSCSDPGMERYCNWMVPTHEGHPINCVDWFQAKAYCEWAGDGTKRLPTEAEWEKAARGTDTRAYPWGDEPEPSCSHVVMSDAMGPGCGYNSTMTVGSKSTDGDSPYGAQDMAGNVWEWVSDWYASSYEAADVDNPIGPIMGDLHVIRGGAWYYDDSPAFRVTTRGMDVPTGTSTGTGFRCARTPPAAL